MADERLIAHIDLDASGLQQGAASATRTLNKLGQQTAQAGASARRMGVDFMGTSRVMQDFAFGPAAIANNMEGLAREFQQMQRISKETGQTLTQTLVASLTGGGGLNLAVGALTFGMSLASVGMAAWTRIIDGHSKAAKKAAQDYKFLTDSVGSYNQSLQQGLKSGQDELAHLTRLQAVVQNNALSANERKEAYTELVKTYPTYFRSLSQEQVMAGNVGNAYATLRTRILEVAQARAVEGKIGKLAEKQLDIQQALGFQSKMIPKIKQQIIDYMNANSQFAKVQDAATISSEDFEAAIKRWRTGHFANKEFDGLVDKLNTYRERAKASEAASNQLTGSIETLSKSAALTNVGLTVDPLANIGKVTKPRKEKLPITWIADAKTIEFDQKAFEKAFNFSDPVKKGIENVNAILSTLPESVGKFSKAAGNSWIDFVNNFQDGVNQILQNGFAETLSGVGEAIGGLVAGTASSADAIQLVLSPIADMLISLGKLAIQTGLSVEGIKAALKSLNPAVAIAAGVALIALGSAVKGSLSSMAGGKGSGSSSGPGFGYRPVPFANGGIVSGPTLGLVGEYANARNNPEVIAPLDKLKGMLGGGSQVQVMIPDVRFSNEAMYISFKRGERSYKSKT